MGTSTLQRSITNGQRVWNRQPGGGAMALGTSPESTMRSRFSVGFGCGIADNSAFVYGWRGSRYSSAALAVSTRLPKYITPIRSEMYFTTARLCAMNTYERPNC